MPNFVDTGSCGSVIRWACVRACRRRLHFLFGLIPVPYDSHDARSSSSSGAQCRGHCSLLARNVHNAPSQYPGRLYRRTTFALCPYQPARYSGSMLCPHDWEMLCPVPSIRFQIAHGSFPIPNAHFTPDFEPGIVSGAVVGNGVSLTRAALARITTALGISTARPKPSSSCASAARRCVFEAAAAATRSDHVVAVATTGMPTWTTRVGRLRYRKSAVPLIHGTADVATTTTATLSIWDAFHWFTNSLTYRLASRSSL
jgi:hypothetical protein